MRCTKSLVTTTKSLVTILKLPFAHLIMTVQWYAYELKILLLAIQVIYSVVCYNKFISMFLFIEPRVGSKNFAR